VRNKNRKHPMGIPYIPKHNLVAIESSVVKEHLPFPFVHYPNLYGTFIGFSRSIHEKPMLCTCVESAVYNYLRLAEQSRSANSNPLRVAPFDSFYFPDSIARESLVSEAESRGILTFKKAICHRCLMATPSLRFCHPMYGSEFKQSFGWYINQSLLRSGVDCSLLKYLPDVCPPQVLEPIRRLENALDSRNSLIMQNPESAWAKSADTLRTLDKEIAKLRRYIWNIFENETRSEFGVRKIGE